MIFLIAMLAAQVPPPAATDDIVVTGQRLARIKRLKLKTKVDRKTGITRCVFSRSSGDSALDAAVCDATLACVAEFRTVPAVRACLTPAMNALVEKGVPWKAG